MDKVMPCGRGRVWFFYLFIITREFPRVIAIKIKKSNEFNIETLALNLTAKVELNQFFFGGMETEARHHHVMFMVIIIVILVGVVSVAVIVVAHACSSNCHKLLKEMEN